MPIPDSVKVGPHIYSVLIKPESEMDGKGGYCLMNALEVWISEGLLPSKMREYLVHELLHACTYPAVCEVKRYTDEQFIINVSVQWLGVMRENPELVAFLVG